MASVILSDVIDIISGGTPKTSEAKYWSGGNIDWLSINDFNNGNRFVYNSEKKITELALKESNTKLLNKGDVIISARGTVGVLAQIGKPMCFNQSCFGLRGKKGLIDNDFLYYVLKNYIHNLKKKSQGSVFDTINIKSFDLMEIDIPNYASQCSIASVLSALDKKIELNNRINAELEAMAKTLYDYWFVQFDFPDEEGKPYKSSGGKMVYNTALKREIPEGWRDGIIEEVLDKVPHTIKLLNKNILRSGKYPVVDQGQEYICGFTDTKESVLEVKDAHIIFGDHTTIVKLVNFDYSRGADGTQILISKEERIPNYLLYQMVNNLNLTRYGYARHFKFLKEAKIILPMINISNKYNEIVIPIYEKWRHNFFENINLSELRDFLLPMLMNGQVTIK
jgi:type I restriction enzyme, S subunit